MLLRAPRRRQAMISETAKLDRQIVRVRVALKELYIKKKRALRKQKEIKDRLEQVFELAAAGKTVNEIARAMRIEHGTVCQYVRNAPHWLALVRLHKERPDTESQWNVATSLTAEEKQKIDTWEQEFSEILAPLKHEK
jgi:DNA-binding CsgD family transcriptional regulator